MPAAQPPSPIPQFQLRKGAPFWAREPRPARAATNVANHFTEFYLQSDGSNLNAGSTTDSSAVYTSTNGNWSTSTNIFTPTDGSNPWPSVQPGMFASIYNDGASTAVYIARITSVTNAANGAINITTSAAYGTAPTTSATGRSIKVGGAWLGPNGASNFPFALSGLISSLIGPAGDMVRVNAKNDQTYSVTAALSLSTLGTAILQGYSSIPGDGGKATFSSNITSGVNFTGGNSGVFVDLIFASTGASNANDCFNATGATGITFIRCVFHGARGAGVNCGKGFLLWECEAYDCNRSNTSASAGILASSGSSSVWTLCVHCFSHDHTQGANGDAFGGVPMALINCIASNSSGCGINTGVTNLVGTEILVLNSNFYNIRADAIKIAYGTFTGFPIFQNNNFVSIGGRAINNTCTSQGGIFYNNGRVNIGAEDLLKSIVNTGTDFRYATGVTPWLAPDTGDFSTVLAAAIGAGRAAFTETDGTNAGTTGYPDVGAAQAQTVTQSFSTTGTQTLPYGYVSHIYGWKWFFASNTTITLQSGSLPPGLILATVSPNCIAIQGTPTAVGIYDFVLRSTAGTSTGDSPFEITILADPDEGIGGLLGGLRPTC